jgi:hypothetical protein
MMIIARAKVSAPNRDKTILPSDANQAQRALVVGQGFTAWEE